MLPLNNQLLRYMTSYLLIIISSSILWFLADDYLKQSPVQVSLIVLIAVTLISSFLFYSIKKAPETVFFSIINCAVLAALTLIVACLNEKSKQHIGLCLKSSYVVFFISLFLHSLIKGINTFFDTYPQTPLLLLFFTLFMSTIPLWLSPWVESSFSAQSSLQLILWSSPLTYASSMLDYDYLHSQWFYQHTPYGMYRFDYPNTFYITFGLTAMALPLLFYSKKTTPS